MAKSSSFFKKIAMFFATAAIAAMLVPAVAFADVTTYGSDSGPDNIIGVTWVADDDTVCEATVNLNNLVPFTTTKGALFNKNGWRVVGTNSYVTLSQVLYNAVYTDGSDTYRASEVWGAGKYLSFNVWNSTNNGWVCEPYTKYTDFTFANIAAATDFYGGTTVDNLGTVATDYYTDMIIALNGNTIALSGTTTADDALSVMVMNTNDAPRVMQGYLNPANVGGNRFPSNIDRIAIG